MQSHFYDYTARQLLGIVAPILAVFLGSIVVLHLVDWAGWPPLRLDDGGIRHQIKMAHSHHPAQIVFVGDSTCWCGIDASELSKELPGHVPALNLSLFIWFDLKRYAQQTADFARSNPNQVKWVVLLVCAGKLSDSLESPDNSKLWYSSSEKETRSHSFLGSDDFFTGSLLCERWAQLIFPETLHGRGANFFGFTSEIGKFMTAHDGGAFDFGEYIPFKNQKNTYDWNLPVGFEPFCRSFREKMAPGAKLAIGLTPAVLGTIPPDSRDHHLARLEQWNSYIHADLVLSNLPVTLPTPCFAPGGHLNALGQKIFTSAVAKEISPVLR